MTAHRPEQDHRHLVACGADDAPFHGSLDDLYGDGEPGVGLCKTLRMHINLEALHCRYALMWEYSTPRCWDFPAFNIRS